MSESFIFFWGAGGECGAFSQWSHHSFQVDGVDFRNAETYMMYHKALLFEDHEIANEMLIAKDPKKVKGLGRKVKNFNEDKWVANRLRIVTEGNMAKFSQNEDAKKILMRTGEKTLVEASPLDSIWGIGYDEANAMGNREFWGLNLLGQALMDVRRALKEQ
eukprot:TRINITY_DN11245_c0_g1_i1.p1 TRINITY_DN11245_c0_g1~~TRINITY_DN11245_c0_g1_i1.p1  ORF type:complete len:161 (+),score=60.54 TRINITY_DN11245_c0_g1_i1:163-645(+)